MSEGYPTGTAAPTLGNIALRPAVRQMAAEHPGGPGFEPRLDVERSWLRRRAQRLVGERLRADVDASDLTQEALLSAERARHGKSFHSRGAFRAWLKTILRNTAAQLGRRTGHARADDQQLACVHSRASSPSMGLRRREGASDVLRHLKGLSDRDREVVLLRVVEDLPFAGIGARLGVTEVHARVLFNRAVVALRQRGPAPDRG